MTNHVNAGREQQATSSELLSIPFLDTDTARDTQSADEELGRRGYPNWLIRLLRRIFSIGLWTQSFTWEEWHLDLNDVLAGYGVLLLGLGFIVALSAFVTGLWSWHIGAYIFLIGVGLLILAILGWRFHSWRNHQRPK